MANKKRAKAVRVDLAVATYGGRCIADWGWRKANRVSEWDAVDYTHLLDILLAGLGLRGEHAADKVGSGWLAGLGQGGFTVQRFGEANTGV